jgi:hypothetical protein
MDPFFIFIFIFIFINLLLLFKAVSFPFCKDEISPSLFSFAAVAMESASLKHVIFTRNQYSIFSKNQRKHHPLIPKTHVRRRFGFGSVKNYKKSDFQGRNFDDLHA